MEEVESIMNRGEKNSNGDLSDTKLREEELIEKIKRSAYRDRLIEMWMTLSQGEKERFLFRKVTLDQNIPDIMNEREMMEILTPKKEDTTEKFVNKVIESLTNYIRKGGRRTLAQIVGTRVEFLLSIQNILEIKELKLEDIYDIPIPLLMGIITSKMKSSEGLPIEEITASWTKLDWSDQTRIGLESVKYIADILASKDRLLSTFKHNEANIIEYLYKRIGNNALRNHFKNYQEEKSNDESGKGQLKKITTVDRFTEILREVSNTWEREAVDVRNRSSKKETHHSYSTGKKEGGDGKRKRQELEVNVTQVANPNKEEGKGSVTKYCFNCWHSNHLIAECKAPKYEELSSEEKIKRQKRTRDAKKKREEEQKRK